jgi:hypothetical protein
VEQSFIEILFLKDEKMREYITLKKTLLVLPEGDPIFTEAATEISLEDEGAGPFVTISQSEGDTKIRIMSEEWHAIKNAIDDMMDDVCRKLNKDAKSALDHVKIESESKTGESKDAQRAGCLKSSRI